MNEQNPIRIMQSRRFGVDKSIYQIHKQRPREPREARGLFVVQFPKTISQAPSAMGGVGNSKPLLAQNLEVLS